MHLTPFFGNIKTPFYNDTTFLKYLITSATDVNIYCNKFLYKKFMKIKNLFLDSH